MKRIFLLRSARHRTRTQTVLPDYHHPLTRRGEIAAMAVGQAMRKNNDFPDLVICAAPARTRQTLAQIWPSLLDASRRAPELIYDYQIHLMRGEQLLERLREVDEKFGSLLAVSIAPGVNDLARLMWRQKNNEPNPFDNELAPGNLAIFDCPVSTWAEIEPHTGHLVRLIT